MRGYAVGKLERQVEKTHTDWRTFLKVSWEPRMLVNSYSVGREISGSISSVGSILRILKYLTSFALHCPTLEWHHDDFLSSPVSGRRHKKTKATWKWTQQLPTLLRQQCWELLRACWQWCANGCNNSQQCWDLQCIVGRIQPISLCKPRVMSLRGPNIVGRVGSCWLKSLTGFKLCATTSNNMQQGVQTDATCNIQQCCVLLHAA